MKTLLVALVVLLVVFAGFVLYASTRPDAFRVQRSIVVAATPEQILPLIEDFRQWRGWSPFEDMDPDLKRSFSGAPRGVGAVYEWTGNSKAGAGRMEIEEASPARVLIKLDFSKPFEAHNIADFALEPEGSGTRVAWAMYGPSPLIAKLVQTFVSMDRMVGGEFEKGLARLKALAEREALPKG